jgi:hypothetical protein
MNSKMNRIRALLPAAFGTLVIASSQQTAAPPDVAAQLVQRLPNDWKGVAAQHRIFSDFYKYLLKDDDDDLRFETLNLLVQKPGAEEFVAAHLHAELLTKGSAKYHSRILYELAYGNNWTDNPLTIPLLEREATGIPIRSSP